MTSANIVYTIDIQIIIIKVMNTNRLVPINLRLPESLIKESDRLARQEGSNRSELFRNALRSYLAKNQKLQTAYSIVEQRGELAGINSPEDLENILK